MATDSTSWTRVQDFLQNSDHQTIACFNQVNWDQLCRIASDANRSLECVTLDQITSGLNNVVRQLEFSDKTRWAARIPIIRSESSCSYSKNLQNEIATMQFIQENSSLRVPRVFVYDTDMNNAAEAAFMLIEMLPGIVAMDALGGHKVHGGVIPVEYRKPFYRSVAECHVQMTSLRLPKIGAIIRREDGGYETGPIPGIGGPFDTAAAFFEAWADNIKFKLDKETITQMMQRGPISAEEMVKMTDEFPSQIKSMAKLLPLRNEGPFPLCHDDFLHSNIMVDEASFNVTGIIDWEGACTVPWGLVTYPEFIQVMPRSFDLPQHYDQDGHPLKESVKEKWREQRDYVEMVKTAEGEDNLLSTSLSSNLNQALAYSYGAFTTGKLGFYDRVVTELKKGTQV
ncbi:Putative aminoglycoside phosphotransferase, protein kinase-like domain superfamily [Colletotrichum destructivum]|uniref:Aminoglycoside phosphotransferase, protein kinase-like domain superfamily n=1 Tax=Colletotrichum destructivum TaxID=34406 RepID=A0AAX4IM79_9PEZI|nr:Putative aminoglycoside phosphotransferase, protein kinase-like domain superfamily [Colletotrichum destructivum]